jgi:hypothetical protein
MENKLYTFHIPCSWSVYGIILVEAENLDQAIENAHNEGLPNDWEYMDGSFEIDSEYAEEQNAKVLKQIEQDKRPLDHIVENAFKQGGLQCR